ncbi:MAG: xanthine dehydrogenase family protein subunit M [Candidatus Velamenicoccus archaeovorus]
MKPAPFAYEAPATLDEAVGLLARYGDEAKVLAGGQSLAPLLAFRLAAPTVLIDLNGVRELEHAHLDGDTLVLGALTRHRTVEQMAELRTRCRMLAEGVSLIGHVAIRNRGTVGGSLAHADPAAEWPSLVLALDGEIDATGPTGTRTIPAAGFFESYFTTTLAADEIVREVRLHLPDGGRTGSTYVELARRHGDFALAGVGALLSLGGDGTISDARVVLIGVRDRAVRSAAAEAILRGSAPSEELFAEAAEAIDGEIDPVSDIHGSSDFRRHLAKVLVRRALGRARDRAEQGAPA